MKTSILKGVVLISALALASCSTTNQIASNKKMDDDVYFSKARAGDAPEYRMPINDDERYTNANGDDDDYYYYDSYASRINRFGYASPFSYYDDYYYGYSPYGYGAYSPYYSGWSLGVGLGYGWGYPYGGYGWGYPYSYGYYSPYSYWGTGFGYGGPYWGVYSAYNNGNYRARPNRNFGTGTAPGAGRIGYNGNYPNTGYYPGRTTNSMRGGSGNANYGGRQSRGVRTDNNPQQPTYRPNTINRPAPSYNPGNSGSYGGGGGRSSGGGGARPSRP